MFECVRITQVHLNVFLIGAVNLIDKGGGGGGGGGGKHRPLL